MSKFFTLACKVCEWRCSRPFVDSVIHCANCQQPQGAKVINGESELTIGLKELGEHHKSLSENADDLESYRASLCFVAAELLEHHSKKMFEREGSCG